MNANPWFSYVISLFLSFFLLHLMLSMMPLFLKCSQPQVSMSSPFPHFSHPLATLELLSPSQFFKCWRSSEFFLRSSSPFTSYFLLRQSQPILKLALPSECSGFSNLYYKLMLLNWIPYAFIKPLARYFHLNSPLFPQITSSPQFIYLSIFVKKNK